MGWFSVKAGNPIANPNELKNKKIAKVLIKISDLTNLVGIMVVPRLLNVVGRQYRFKNV
jgi:hypothetical protein